MTEFDNRRRQYVPLYVMVAFGKFGSKLIEKWGIEGIGTWMLFLAACKREPVQGTLTYTSDDEAWTKLGARAAGFTLDEFWRVTGHLKKTSRRRSGRISYVTCTVWEDWNTARGGSQNPRSDQQNTEDLPRDVPGKEQNATPEVEVDFEVDSESEEKATASRDLATVVPLPIVGAQSLIAHYVDRSSDLGMAPPSRVKGQVAKLVDELLREGIAPERVEAGLDLLLEKRTHPATLPSLVHEASLPRREARNGRVTPTEILAEANRLREQEARFHDAG